MTQTAENGRAVRFVNKPARYAALAFGCLVVFIGVGGLLSSDWSGLVWVGIGLLFAWRGLTTAVLILTPEEVDFRGFGRRRRVRLDELSAADVAVGKTGMGAFNREYLVVHRLDGTAIAFKDLNARPSARGRTVVQVAALAINAARQP